MTESALTLMTRLNMQVGSLLSALDIDLIGKETGKILRLIRRLSEDARLDVRDWEMSDSRVEMEQHAQVAKKRLEELRKQVLKASEHGIFSAVDVVHISAQIDSIEDML
jgi:hypothetical protein